MRMSDEGSRLEKSYLTGDQWVLKVSVTRRDTQRATTWHHTESEIIASYAITEKWNEQFWALFPTEQSAFCAQASGREGIVVYTDFPFRTTVSFRDRYGNHSLAKIQRVAKHWRSLKHPAPPEIREVIAAFEKDQSLYDQQYHSAWQELTRLRLPTPPGEYYWYYYPGGLMVPGVCFFRLWHPTFGYAPTQE